MYDSNILRTFVLCTFFESSTISASHEQQHTMTAEQQRLSSNALKTIPLEQWGPYLSERQWSTVREDYSDWGDAWHYFPFDQSHYRVYKWGEDGLAGISDYMQHLCFAIALWNGKDKILKERLFGLANSEGNHGEDVKELYYYLDNTPTHGYMQYLYKYPQQEFPYEQLREENRKRSRNEPEFELLDTEAFAENAYFDVLVTYAKCSSQDIAIRIDITNRYHQPANIHVLPTLWFYNRWSNKKMQQEPCITYENETSVRADHEDLGSYHFYFQPPHDLLFTDNENNTQKIWGIPNSTPFVKDAFHDAVIRHKQVHALRRRKKGTKCAPVYKLRIDGGKTASISCRLAATPTDEPFGPTFQEVFDLRKKEADEYYDSIRPKGLTGDLAAIHRQALAGLLWSKQFYHYDVERWLAGSDGPHTPGEIRKKGRNHDWTHLKNQDIISMPDKWEYPWYAAWDLAFQCISMAVADPTFAKHQLLLVMREWYMKPDGQLPAYEWNFSDVNPPVHAWAAMQVYQIEKQRTGKGDIIFLKKIFHKLLINFTWWTNRKDRKGDSLFEGGFLGLDNIGVFNRSHHFSNDTQLEQADGTSWMGTYALDMMDMAIEIATEDPSFEDTATKFFEHFVLIAAALNEHHLWNEEDKFFYDVLCVPDAEPIQLRIQSIVGLTPLFAVSTIDAGVLGQLSDFNRRISWFENYRKKNKKFWPNEERHDGKQLLLSLVPRERLVYLLEQLLDEDKFLSPGGIRALSKYHLDHPYSVTVDGHQHTISYEPGDSTSDMFGGNSNWRGPVWMPLNYLVIQSIRTYGEFYRDELKVEFPSRSGKLMNLIEVAHALSQRVISLFSVEENGGRRCYGDQNWFYRQPENQHLVLFYEYFHGDNGRGLGASHQTGWTALVAELISEYGQ
ncbi:MAG: hypothetical protein RL732_1607 [Bacteroidota bacterium]